MGADLPAATGAGPGATVRSWGIGIGPVPAMTASSSRTSMPTGHQAMHRPQPTQPLEPNWSHQVENLWVSHWR